MNFTSQICTIKEQSERLLALGLKRETADCFLEYVGRDNCGNNVWHPSIIVNNYRMPDYSRDFPAWSLHRLIEMLPEVLAPSNNDDWEMPLSISTDSFMWTVEYDGGDFILYEAASVELIDALYDMIVKLKEEGVI